jgi:hypothetical protein
VDLRGSIVSEFLFVLCQLVADCTAILSIVIVSFKGATSFHCRLVTMNSMIRKGRNATRRLRLKCDGTRAETRFRLSAKGTSPFKSAAASVQSTTGSRGVRISGSNAQYTMFRGSAKSTGYPLHLPVSPSLPLPCVTVCHHISTGRYTLALLPIAVVSASSWSPYRVTCHAEERQGTDTEAAHSQNKSVGVKCS